jgi:hypothetical protein
VLTGPTDHVYPDIRISASASLIVNGLATLPGGSRTPTTPDHQSKRKTRPVTRRAGSEGNARPDKSDRA